jgi:hypothetical protein
MKTAGLFLIVALTSCASNPSVQQPRPTECSLRGDNTPPNTMEVVMSTEKQEQIESSITEEKLYWNSVDSITTRIREEALNLAICAEEATDKNECAAMRSKYCQVDILIDSRGGHHNKPFCRDIPSRL